MAQWNSLNVKLPNSQLDKLKSAIKNKTEAILRLSSSMVSDDETNFHHRLGLGLTAAASAEDPWIHKKS